MGTPEAMYDPAGAKVWSCELNSYGKVRKFQGEYKDDCPFRYQGQYHDPETGLHYNRFRYYSPEEGMYLSHDPIGLLGGHRLYEYVNDNNVSIDIYGLKDAMHSEIKINGVVVGTGNSGQPGKTYPALDPKLSDVVSPAAANANTTNPKPYYGECAEINAINNALGNGYTLEDLRGAEITTTVKNYKGTTIDGRTLEEGDPVEACDCCAAVIDELGMIETNRGCGNKV